MKVIGFTGNYGMEDMLPQTYLMADSSILYSGRPLFVPDFAREFIARPTIVVRTGRLGKCIAAKFAHRYWDAFTAGFAVEACGSDAEMLHGLDRAFDGSAVVGDWVGSDSVADMLHEPVEVMVNDTIVSNHCLADMCHPLEELLSAVSTRCSIKMGDMLLTGDTGGSHVLKPGDRLTARIAGQVVLDVKVKL